ncbi:DUF4082 domain-containing protein [Nocardioides sp. LMS-CY]|uniref:DUF4082 domain-containing protein n=1 Tax=Nocardioides sp. (strain LMS-CY) TaxID=2840457 RepID=UPI001C006089|nr:DUF4082 domain-containing protein [Nocardioides sp. LMS-CY]QWF21450.1 DUF4082 domain-containing protein [Nocardioides sp. LMS-CY]
MAKRSTRPPIRGRVPRRVAALVVLVLGLAGLTAVTTTNASAAIDPCGPSGNKISCENSKPGTDPSVWDVEGAGDESIQGFATDISVNVGQRIDFKVDTDASAYTITIYRLGYYGGDGAREITTVPVTATLPQHQPQCITDVSTELYDCGNWAVSASWNVPSTAVSGVYIARLHRADRNDSSHITFIVRDDSSHSDVVFQTSDPTWQAYNLYGGSDFYRGAANGRSYKVSYNRPVMTRDGIGGRDFFFANEYPLVRFLERNGYDVSYLAGVDTDRYGSLIRNHKVFLSVGHDEYWSKAQRANVEAARDAGVNLQFLSGNEVYWKTRYEPSADASHTAYRTLVSYKETWSNAKIDPSTEWTGTWRDPRFAPKSAGGGVPENSLTGTIYTSNYTDLPITVSAQEGKNRLWRGTSLASMSSGSAALAPHTVGYESDEDLDNGARPPGLIRLSTTTGPTDEYLQDFGNTVAPGTTTHNMTMYRAASGALVFGAGTVQWTWGLDAEHDSPFAPEPADPRMQQAQVNLLADMSAQPTTLQSGLVSATKSTDTTGPTVTVNAPAANSTQGNGTSVTVTGTATDAGGGVVAGVEVSTDAGATWHAATGRASFTYTYTQHGRGAESVRVRAMDDSANIGATVSRTVNVTCPCSVFGNRVPQTPASSDASAAELGLRFSPTNDGFVTGVRFYKGTGNTGTHVGSLWSSSGQKLASVTFQNESATGWQSATFSSAVPVTAGQTYVVSYTVPNGRYAVQPWDFASTGVDASPLMVAGGYGATPAGVFGNAGTFPNSSYQNSNYFVDVLYTASDESPLTATNQWPLPGSSSVPRSTAVSAQFSKPLTQGSAGLVLKDANGATVAGSSAYDATTRTITFTPTAALAGFVTYTATLSGTDTQGNAVSSGKTWSFRTAKPPATPGVCPCSLFDEDTVPTLLQDADTVPVTLGVRFSPDVTGTVTGVRFYKGVNNTGTHAGSLWSASGTLLAQGTFSGESTTGWQTLTFAQPVAVTKNTEYVASYRTEVGRYSATPNAFAAANLSRSPLIVTSSAGAYTYGSGFPSSTSPSSYLVDVVFEKGAPTLTVTGQDPAPGALSVPRQTPITVSFSSAIGAGYTMAVKQGSTAIAGSTALSSDGKTLTFTPAAALPASADITVTVSGVTSIEGAALATQSWTFRTRDADSISNQTLFGDVVPGVLSASEGSAVELGTAFTPSKDGTVTAVRFYKGTGNGGTHVGSLWTSSGTKLASVTFGNETASGWQQATLSTPLAVSAGTTYVVSYLAPQGHYSYTSGFFGSPYTAGDLTAPATSNGRYLYGAAGGFPTFSWGASNYFVDVVFQRTVAPLAIVDRSPAPAATDVPRSAQPSIRVSAPLAPGWAMTVKQGTTPIAGTTSLSGDGQTITFAPAAQLPADADLTIGVTGLAGTGGATLADQSWTFHTEAGASALSSLFSGTTPSIASIDDNGPVELGVAFVPSVAGSVTAIRFYKGAGNTGTHTGSLWSASGTRLATVTFTGETSSGWQTAALSTPVALTAGTTYVVSYFAPNGHYSATPAFFNSPYSAGVLSAPAGSNGRYVYGASGGFPTGWWNSTNYFVDVVFRSAQS